MLNFVPNNLDLRTIKYFKINSENADNAATATHTYAVMESFHFMNGYIGTPYLRVIIKLRIM